ncbi:hypothetical protein K438DRAFT_1978163 [Mycena galopus ATCC 62051]|nr:hypothetical protein K438DRAFT_1978163 [Mycena galopus ATCC 62051]
MLTDIVSADHCIAQTLAVESTICPTHHSARRRPPPVPTAPTPAPAPLPELMAITPRTTAPAPSANMATSSPAPPLPQNHSYTIFGNFNKHHTLWSGPLHPARIAGSNTTLLINIMTTHGLSQCVKASTTTYYSPVHHTTSTIDLVFVLEVSLGPLLKKCEALPDHGSDLALISCIFTIPLEHCAPRQCHNFCRVDWKEFSDLLESHIATNPLLPLPLTSPEDIDAYVDTLTSHLVTVLEACPSPYTHHWWDSDL